MTANREARLTRRLMSVAVALSASIALVATALAVRGRFVREEFVRCQWDPANRTYGELRLFAWGGVLSIHSEVAPATATKNTAVVRGKAGPTGTRWTHSSQFLWSNGYMGEPKMIWVDRYRAGPLVGINPRGLADCWTVMARMDVVAAVFGILPVAWFSIRLKRRLDRRGPGRQGFVPIVNPA